MIAAHKPDAPEPKPERAAIPADWQRQFIERVGAVADVSGLPPSIISVFAWLVVSDPPDQSVDQMREALGLSAGAISMATVALIRMGLVERVAQPGSRRLYYRFGRAGWERMLRLRLEGTAQMRRVAEEALAAAPEASPRLAEMRDLYAWFEEHVSQLLDAAPWST